MLTIKDLEHTKIATKGRNKELLAKLKELGLKDLISSTHIEYFLETKYIYINHGNWSRGEDEYMFRTNSSREVKVEDLLKEEMKNYTVSEQFIKDAHKAACSTWKGKLEEQFPEVFPKITYKLGSVFVDATDTKVELTLCKNTKNYFLMCTGKAYPFEVWNTNTVESNLYNTITEEQLKFLVGDSNYRNFKLKQ